MDIEELPPRFAEMIVSKVSFYEDLERVIRKNDRQNLIEILIENAIEDMRNFDQVRYMVGVCSFKKPFDIKTLEDMKTVLFEIAGIRNLPDRKKT